MWCQEFRRKERDNYSCRKDLRLVVVRGFGQCAMLILTTLQGDGSKEDVWRVVQGYLARECAERSEGRSRSDALAGVRLFSRSRIS